MIFTAHELGMEFRGNRLLQGASFYLARGEQVGLVGPNGSGKTTLLRILSGELAPLDGSVTWHASDVSIGYFRQDRDWAPDRLLGEVIGPISPEILARCGITQSLLLQPCGSLSGGQATRAALAQLVAVRPAVLFLDEPTNHLDAEGLTWLEGFIQGYQGTVLVVSHDRWFLDRVVTRILAIEDGQVVSYTGNYSAYAHEKQVALERAEAAYEHYAVKRKQLIEAIRTLDEKARAGSQVKVARDASPAAKAFYAGKGTAAARTSASLKKRLERMAVEKPVAPVAVNVTFGGSGKVGRNLVLAERLGFTYDGQHWLLRDGGFSIQRGERVAILGPNGAGKTTLLRLILGQVAPTEGKLYHAPVRIAYLDQALADLHPSNSIWDEVRSAAQAEVDATAIRTLLACLMFRGDAINKRIGNLSYGERVRVTLAKILVSDPDVLVLDEPTNGLDLPTRERVEAAIEAFQGTLLVVSHDRYLVDRLCTRRMLLRDGRIDPDAGAGLAVKQPAKPSDVTDQRLLLETRLAQLSAQLAAPPPGEAERLNAEFLAVSRELRALREGK